MSEARRQGLFTTTLNHPHICTVHDVGSHEGRDFIVMELLEGETLKHRIARQRLRVDEVCELGAQVADALAAAHGVGMIHRDVRPANLFVTGRGEAKVLDFGLAKLLDRGTAAPSDPSSAEPDTVTTDAMLTGAGSAVGTPAYMSPEQARGEALDARSDPFSFGALLYEMATGRRPFSGGTAATVFDAILNRDPEPIRGLRPDVPDELERVIGKALEKDPGLRYQTAAEMRADLLRTTRDRALATGDTSRVVSEEPEMKPGPLRGLARVALASLEVLGALFAARQRGWLPGGLESVPTPRSGLAGAAPRGETDVAGQDPGPRDPGSGIDGELQRSRIAAPELGGLGSRPGDRTRLRSRTGRGGDRARSHRVELSARSGCSRHGRAGR